MSFDILMAGVGNAFSRDHFGTCFLARSGDYVLGVDCPDSYRTALREHGFEHDGDALDVDRVDAMFITHLHGDHVNGLEMALAYRRYVSGGPWQVYTSEEVAPDLWPRRLQVSLGQTYNGESYDQLTADDYYELTAVAPGEPIDIGPFEVTTRPTTHHLPTVALRITDGDHTLGYSCDTAYDPDLIDWLSDADLILHETSFGPGHTPLEKLIELPEHLREKMRVVHLPEGFEPIEEVTFAEQGRVYRVG